MGISQMIMRECRDLILTNGVAAYGQVKEVNSPIWVVVTHGVGEHLVRHHYLDQLLGPDFNLFFYDLRGHGRSEGTPAFVEDFALYRQDLGKVLDFLKNYYGVNRYILFGHSMGALITADYLQNCAREDFYPEGVFLSSPPVGFPGPLGKVVDFAPEGLWGHLAALRASISLGGVVDVKHLSQDKRILKAYQKDPYNHLKLHTRLLFNLVCASKRVFSKPLGLRCPSYCTIGGEDVVTCPTAAQEYFTQIEHSTVFKIFEGAYHEIHNEVEKYRRPYLSFLKKALIKMAYPSGLSEGLSEGISEDLPLQS